MSDVSKSMSSDSKVEIWASIGITKNLGNYESLRLDAGARTTASSLNDSDAWAELWGSIDSQIEAKLQELDAENGK
jgi:hypothetical protein